MNKPRISKVLGLLLLCLCTGALRAEVGQHPSVHDIRLVDEPFWLRERGFVQTGREMTYGNA